MKREILFRGKSVYNGEWVYGDLLQIANSMIIYHGSRLDANSKEDSELNENVAIEIMMNEITPIFPETVGQFTGLLDINNVKVFEGDILTIPDKGDGVISINVNIFISSYAFGFKEPPTSTDECLLYEIVDSYVIGNIHDGNKH